MSEEDQMMRAIAMSLGQDIPMDQRAESPEVKTKTKNPSYCDSQCWIEKKHCSTSILISKCFRIVVKNAITGIISIKPNFY